MRPEQAEVIEEIGLGVEASDDSCEIGPVVSPLTSAAPPPAPLLCGVAALVTAVEELEAAEHILSLPRGTASLLLVRLITRDAEARRCFDELDRLRRAADIPPVRPRWAAETLQAVWGLDRLLRYSDEWRPERIFGGLEPSRSAMLNLAEDRLNRGEGDTKALRSIARRLRARVADEAERPKERIGVLPTAVLGLPDMRGPFRVWIELDAGAPVSTSQLAELLADHQRSRTEGGAVSALARDPLA